MRRSHFHQLIAILCIGLVVLNDHVHLYAPNIFVCAYNFSAPNFRLSGQITSTYSRLSNDCYTSGTFSSSDSNTVDASYSGSYTASGQGSFVNAYLSVTSLNLSGGGNASYNLTQTGWTNKPGSGTISYNHNETFVESTSINLVGKYSQAGWTYSAYSSVTNWTDQFNETVGPNLATGTISDKTSVNLTSTTITGSGTYNWNSRGYSFPSTATVSAGNNASTLNTLMPGLGVAFSDPANWVLAPSLQLTTPGLNALNVATVGMGSLSPPSLLNTRTPVPTFTSLTNLREVQFARPAPFGGWLVSGQVVGMLNWPTSYMPVTLTMQLQNLFTGVPAKAMQDVLTHLDNVMASGPVTLYGEPVFYNEAGRVGVSVSMNFLAQLGVYQDYVAGELDILTAGLSQRYLNDAGLGWLVNTNSTAFRAGQYAGMVINVILQFTPLAPFVDAIQAQGHLENAEEAYLNGDNYTAALEAVNAVGAISRALPVCNIGGVTAMVARGVSLVNGVANVVSAVNAVQNGDTLSAILNIGFAMLNFYAASRACFRGLMLLRGMHVKILAKNVKVGDLLAARNQTDPHSPIEYKVVEEVFVRVAPILGVTIPGQTIETTAEHPFWVLGKGWIPAIAVLPGDLLLTDEGELVPVLRVAFTGEVDTVYNWRIADHHTYFVSATEDGPSIWAHNADYGGDAQNASAQMKKLSKGEIKRLLANGIDPHDLKPNSKYDLFKDRNGNIFVKPRNGNGPGDPTGININGF